MKHIALALALLFGAPDEPTPDTEVRPVARVWMLDTDPEAIALLLVASEILEVDVEMTNAWEPGVIIVDLLALAPGEPVLGTTLTLGKCHHTLWSDRDPIVLAHELGHALGLDHAPFPDSLMYPSRQGGMYVSDLEKAIMAAEAESLRSCADLS